MAFRISNLRADRLLNLLAWLFVLLSFVLSVSFILSTGPIVQKYIYSLLQSDVPSVYGSLYKDAIVNFPDLTTWLQGAFDWMMLPLSFIVAISILYFVQGRTTFYFFVVASIATFVVLMLADIIMGILGISDNSLSVKYIIENVVANFIGSFLASFTLVFVLTISNYCYKYSRGSQQVRALMAGIVSIIMGMIFSVAIFFVADFFYRPLPSKIEAVIGQPIRGIFFSDPKDAKKAGEKFSSYDEKIKPFKLFPEEVKNADLRWWGHSNGRFVANWKSNSIVPIYDLAVTFVVDCYADEINSVKSTAEHTVHFNGVKRLNISIDNGSTSFSTLKNEKVSGQIEVTSPDPRLFSISVINDGRDIEFQQFVRDNPALVFHNHKDELAFFVNASLFSFDDRDDRVAGADRRFTIGIDGSDYIVFARRSLEERSDQTIGSLNCRSVAAGDALNVRNVNLKGFKNFFGVVVRLSRSRFRAPLKEGMRGTLKVTDELADVSLILPKSGLSDHKGSGYLSYAGLAGDISVSDTIDPPLKFFPLKQLDVMGEFLGEYDGPAKLRVSGEALLIWKNRTRGNRTKWERIGWESRAFLLTILGSVGFLATWIGMRIKSDEDIEFLSVLKDRPPLDMFTTPYPTE